MKNTTAEDLIAKEVNGFKAIRKTDKHAPNGSIVWECQCTICGSIVEVIQHDEGVDLIPANIELSALEINLVNVMSREVMLRSIVEYLKAEYDYKTWDDAGRTGGGDEYHQKHDLLL